MTIEPEYRSRVATKYNNIGSIWDESDRWHAKVQQEITQAIERLNRLHPAPHTLVLDIGSGGHNHRVQHVHYVQLDIVFERLRRTPMAVCADAHSLPFGTGIASCVLCVGPVVNYCSLLEVISEIGRVAGTNALVVFHVEFSNSLEFFGTNVFRANAAMAETFYKGEEQLWVYSLRTVIQALGDARLRILYARYFHIVSGLLYWLTRDSNYAARFARLDTLLNILPGIGNFADSGIFICAKTS